MPSVGCYTALCLFFVINSRGEVFLQKRSHLKDVSPMKWGSSSAGHLDAGESYADGTIREVREENGIQIQDTELAVELAAGVHTDFEFVQLRIAHHNGPMRCPPEEIACGEWFAPDLITQWVESRPQDFAKGFICCWEAWLAKGS